MKKIVCLLTMVIFLVNLTACGESDLYTLNSYSNTTESTNINTTSYNYEMKETDYVKYMNKIWVTDSVSGTTPFIYITNIDNGIIEGKWSSHPILPDCYVDSFESTRYGTLTGTIINKVAKCQFKDDSESGVIKLTFKENEEIDAVINRKNDKECTEEHYTFRPYNLEDCDIVAKKTYPVHLDFWGNVNITTGYIEAHHPYAVAYITDKENNIFYQFEGLSNGYRISEVMIKDVNKDGLNDVTIILNHPSLTISYIFIQMENGLFYDSKLDSDLYISNLAPLP